MRISDWSSDVCSSDLVRRGARLIAFVFHDTGDQVANVAFVVDDQDIKRHILLYPAGSGHVPGPIPLALLPIPPPCLPTTAVAWDAGSDRKSTRLNSSR